MRLQRDVPHQLEWGVSKAMTPQRNLFDTNYVNRVNYAQRTQFMNLCQEIQTVCALFDYISYLFETHDHDGN